MLRYTAGLRGGGAQVVIRAPPTPLLCQKKPRAPGEDLVDGTPVTQDRLAGEYVDAKTASVTHNESCVQNPKP